MNQFRTPELLTPHYRKLVERSQWIALSIQNEERQQPLAVGLSYYFFGIPPPLQFIWTHFLLLVSTAGERDLFGVVVFLICLITSGAHMGLFAGGWFAL